MATDRQAGTSPALTAERMEQRGEVSKVVRLHRVAAGGRLQAGTLQQRPGPQHPRGADYSRPFTRGRTGLLGGAWPTCGKLQPASTPHPLCPTP